MFEIHMGVPEMEAFWKKLESKVDSGRANKSEIQIFNRIGKTLFLLSKDPRHPGLHSHEIASLSARYGRKVWESYIENNKPAAGRLFWVYGPGQGEITIIAIEPHPNDKSNAYKKITLSSMGKEIK